MKSLNLKEENIVKDIRNLFRQKKITKISLHLEIKQNKTNKLNQLKIEY